MELKLSTLTDFKFWLHISLIAIFILALTLRIWKLTDIVPILNRDEAALAYNAYLFRQSGMDEWGQGWNLTLQSFGDYKLIGYPATLVALFSILPAEDWVVRLPSVVAGSLLIFVGYFWGVWISHRKIVGLLSALLIAISPVLGHFSRFAYEANIALLLFSIGSLMIFRPNFAKEKNLKMIWINQSIGAILLGITMFFYNTPFILIPILIILMILYFGLLRPSRWLIPAILLISQWLFVYLQLSSLLKQKGGISIFSDETIKIVDFPQYLNSLPSYLLPLLGSKYFYFIKIILNNIGRSFSINFVVNQGGSHPWHSLTGYGHMVGLVYFFSLFWLIVALILFLKRCFPKRNEFKATVAKMLQGSLFAPSDLVLAFLLVSLIPASITVDAPHATRSLWFFFLLSLMSAFGLFAFFNYLKKRSKVLCHVMCLVVVFVLIYQHSSYWLNYFQQYPAQQARLYQSNFPLVLSEIERRYPSEPIAIIDPDGYQYILLAWYLHMPADEYFTTQVRQLADSIGFRYGERVGRYHFIEKKGDLVDTEKIYVMWDNILAKWQIYDSL